MDSNLILFIKNIFETKCISNKKNLKYYTTQVNTIHQHLIFFIWIHSFHFNSPTFIFTCNLPAFQDMNFNYHIFVNSVHNIPCGFLQFSVFIVHKLSKILHSCNSLIPTTGVSIGSHVRSQLNVWLFWSFGNNNASNDKNSNTAGNGILVIIYIENIEIIYISNQILARNTTPSL